MEDPRVVRARRFRLRAAECSHLADMMEMYHVAKRYREMARHYLELAEHEEESLPSAHTSTDPDDEHPPDGAAIEAFPLATTPRTFVARTRTRRSGSHISVKDTAVNLHQRPGGSEYSSMANGTPLSHLCLPAAGRTSWPINASRPSLD